METSEPQNVESSGRNEDGTFAVGHVKIPGSGRQKNSLKDFWRRKLDGMTDEEKLEFSKKLDRMDIWRMAEGQPKQSLDGGEDQEGNPIPIYGGISGRNSDQKDIQPEQENTGVV